MKKSLLGLRIALHWLVLVLMFLAWVSIEASEVYPRGSAERIGIQQIHYWIGIGIWVLLWPRLLLVGFEHHPSEFRAEKDWSRLAAKTMHFALYGFMFAMPIVGWLTLSAKGQSVSVLGWTLPSLLEPNRSVAHWLKEIHEAGAGLGYGLIGLHAAAALLHHYLLGDKTLKRMLFLPSTSA